MKTVYGPVASWRLGKSLGVDLICSPKKICSFDCIYCQLEKTEKITSTVYHNPKPVADPLDKSELFKRRRMEI